ncbi:hypothetical protein AURDEDRAFT_176423 [Auricularia subglabra TFB-10046 SS5]|uniref:C2H2-type domain-containing protein n=1 Tax=Auricularia subglabra (strain TFB-10046 / SS5) TaxID=717982 RepID=J0LDA6_AURST|nr:hypothetical protein AURDEDRAFT_176423 [Auricularia subglabra TFB-10046 SS5]
MSMQPDCLDTTWPTIPTTNNSPPTLPSLRELFDLACLGFPPQQPQREAEVIAPGKARSDCPKMRAEPRRPKSKHLCLYCLQYFRSPSILQVHVVSHTGERSEDSSIPCCA